MDCPGPRCKPWQSLQSLHRVRLPTLAQGFSQAPIMRVNGVPTFPCKVMRVKVEAAVSPPSTSTSQIFPGPGRPPGDRPPWPTVGGGSDLTTTQHRTAPHCTEPHSTAPHCAGACGAEWIVCDTTLWSHHSKAKGIIVVNHWATQHLVRPWYNGSKQHTWTHWFLTHKGRKC